MMCCPALYITPPSGPAGGLFWLPVQWCDHMQSRKSVNAWILSTLPPWNKLKLKNETTGLEQSEQSTSRTAGWSNVESWTAHYGQHHIWFCTACRAGRKFCWSAWRTKRCKYQDRLLGLRPWWSQQRLLFPTFRGDISKITLSRYKMHFLKVTCIFPISTRVKYWFWPLFPFKSGFKKIGLTQRLVLVLNHDSQK